MDNYAEAKIKEALAKSGGNATQAHRLLIALVNNDDRLLRGLSGPFINGIIAHAIQRSGGGKVVPQPKRPAAPAKLTPEAMDKILLRLGGGMPNPATKVGGQSQPAQLQPAVMPEAPKPTSVREAIEARKSETQAKIPTSADHTGSLKTLAQAFKRKQ